jgi:hypothetical protein
MSKLNYLLVLLLVCLTGYFVIGQLVRTSGTALELLADEVVKRAAITIKKAYIELKRYPDSGEEFKTLVLDRLDLQHFPIRIVIAGFIPGSARLPASFNLKIGPFGREVVVKLRYYGSDYRFAPGHEGKLERL